MTRLQTIIFQVACLGLIMLVPELPVPAEWVPFVQKFVAFTQAAQAIIAHAFNPDGTSARAAYLPQPKP